jgi:hypothetical protein
MRVVGVGSVARVLVVVLARVVVARVGGGWK